MTFGGKSRSPYPTGDFARQPSAAQAATSGYRIAALEDYRWLHIGGLGYLPRTVDRSERSPQIVVRSNDNLTPSHRSDQ